MNLNEGTYIIVKHSPDGSIGMESCIAYTNIKLQLQLFQTYW